MVLVGMMCRYSLNHGVCLEVLLVVDVGRHVRYNEQMDRESKSCPRGYTYVRANSCSTHQSIDPETSKLSSIQLTSHRVGGKDLLHVRHGDGSCMERLIDGRYLW
jgi:hypothetical protein